MQHLMCADVALSALADVASLADVAGAVGEVWTPLAYDGSGVAAYDQNAHRQQLCDWIDGTGGRAAAFDFTTKGVLQTALERGELWRLRDASGKAPGLIGGGDTIPRGIGGLGG